MFRVCGCVKQALWNSERTDHNNVGRVGGQGHRTCVSSRCHFVSGNSVLLLRGSQMESMTFLPKKGD